MKRYILIAALGMLSAGAGWAEPRVNVASRAENDARQKVVESLGLLHAADLDWQIIILSDKEWWAELKHVLHPNRLIFGSAFTTLGLHITYLNASWIMTHTTERNAETLAHEWGHIICQCTDEKTADIRGQQIISWPIH